MQSRLKVLIRTNNLPVHGYTCHTVLLVGPHDPKRDKQQEKQTLKETCDLPGQPFRVQMVFFFFFSRFTYILLFVSVMTEAFFDTSGITTAQYLVSRDSDASSTFVKFESTTDSGGDDTPQPTRTTKSIRTAEEVDTDEPADSSNFAVYEG